jgi:hypothetical protein
MKSIEIVARHAQDAVSDLHAESWVQVRSADEILATLDENMCLDGVPFMPEMLAFCGRRMKVYKRAHKTCDYVTNTGMRSLPSTVHLQESRCDGSAHGRCDARCTIYWKEAWLRPAEPEVRGPDVAESAGMAPPPSLAGDAVEKLNSRCSYHDGEGKLRYRCQATEVPSFTRPLAWWQLGQYVEDVRSGNVRTYSEMIPSFLFRAYDNLINLGIGLGTPLRTLYNTVAKLLGGRPYPRIHGVIPAGTPTPVERLGLQPGDLVRVKPHEVILKTLDESARNRGMVFSAEMVPYCEQEFRVSSIVTRLIDEKNGRLIEMKTPAVILDGVICNARYLKNLLFCPRATYPYWREIWLERVER